MRSVLLLTTAFLLPIASAHVAQAQDAPMEGAAVSAGGPLPGPKNTDQTSQPAWAGNLDERANLLGDFGGLRPALDKYGVSFGLTEATEVFGNPSGGAKRAAVIEGLTQLSIGVDAQKAFGIEGGVFNVSAFQIHGEGLSRSALNNINVVSSIEALPTTRLNELWYQQSLFDGKVDVKIGQQSADLEFITSEYEDLFLNSGFGWPTLPATDLPSGGPAYPLATPGVRVRYRPNDQIVALLGVYNGSPAGLKPGDPQKNDRYGTNFNVDSGAFIIGEVQYLVNRGKDATGLPATYKIGAWYNTNRFADSFYQSGDTAQPPGVLIGIPFSKRGDWSVYGAYDQLLYRPAPDSDGGLGVTARVMGAPGDRNVVDFFAQGGFTYKGPFGRDGDTVGVGVEWARISDRARLGDIANIDPTTYSPVRSSETVFEATYQAQIYKWWQIQPDFQFIINPGAGIANPFGTNRRVGNAAVLGVRSVITF